MISPPAPRLPPVVAGDGGGLVPEPADLGPDNNQSGAWGGVKAEVLIQVMVVEPLPKPFVSTFIDPSR